MGKLCFIFGLILTSTLGYAQTTNPPVIPGGVGFGMSTRAGRGGAVIRVTNLNASGAGSLKACVDATGPRVCVFETSGVIRLTDLLVINNSYLTIAGQTAPAPGIMIRGAGIQIYRASDVLIQHIAVRPGDALDGPDYENRDALTISSNVTTVNNIVIDHCSFSWSTDEIFSLWQNFRNVSVTNNIIAESLHNSYHPEGPHGFGLLLGRSAGSVTVYNNLIGTTRTRFPLSDTDRTVIVNNLLYNWAGSIPTGFQTPDRATLNSFVSNMFIPGPDSGSLTVRIYNSTYPLRLGTKIYMSDIATPSGRLADPYSLFRKFGELSDTSLASLETSTAPVWNSGLVVRSTASNGVYNHVLAHAGTRPANRNTTDMRILNDVRNRTGVTKDCISRCTTGRTPVPGGWPTLAANTRRFVIPTDPNHVNADGYTNLEKELHRQAAAVEGTATTSSPTPTPTPTTAPSTIFSASDSYLGNSLNWEPLTASRWSVVSESGDLRYGISSDFSELSGSRLGEYSLVRSRTYDNFRLRAKVRTIENLSTNSGADYDVVFGYQDANNYYYVMYSSAAASVGLFRVQNGVRTEIAPGNVATFADTLMHDITVERQDGQIRAYFGSTLVLSAFDATFRTGRIGIGGFNDKSRWDDITITTLPSYLFSNVDLYLNNSTHYTPTTASRWAIINDGGNLRYGLNTNGYLALSGSRMGEMSLLNNETFSNFRIQVNVRSTEDLVANPSADHCLVFGYVNSSNYYYAMLSASAATTQLFKVVNGVRQNIGLPATVRGVPNNLINAVTLERVGTAIRVYLNGTQILSGTDSVIPTGRVGIGSFNDAALWDDIRISDL
jgi:hypothetical protein